MEQYIQEAVTQSDLNKEDESAIKKQRSFSDAVASEDNDNPSSGFDCNICLDFVQDPVVTLCGHLYCWPCIYKWLHFQSLPSENEQQPQCPVCKAEVSSTTLVPLYGRGGQSTKSSETKAPPPSLGPVIPQRPSGPAFWETLSSSASSRQDQQHLHRQYSHQPQPYHPYLGNYTASGGATTTSAFNPVIGTVGEMVYARVFGNSVTNIYHFPNSYYLADINNPRVRRQIMQADKSLSRICFFLCCSIILCLLLF